MRAQALLGRLVLLLVVAQGCESPPGPTTGALRLQTNTTGGDVDLDGYVATVDNVPHAIAISGTLVVAELATGAHEVSLSGIAANCAATGSGATRSATVVAGDTTDVSFPVACAATGIRVTASTGGLDLDTGYTVLVDGVSAGSLGSNQSRDITRLSAGPHTVSLTGLAANCSVAGDNPSAISISTGAVVAVSFIVGCVATSGVIEITVATTGAEFDPNGYRIQIDSVGPSGLIAVNGTVRLSGVALGQHTVNVMDRVSNCSVTDEHPRTVTVTGGGFVRDTVRVSFAISCVATRGSIRIAAVTTGTELDPDGYSILVDEYCDYYNCNAQWIATVASNGEYVFTDIPMGQHTISIREISRNCTLAGSNPRSVTVEVAATVVVTLDVTCYQTGSIALTVTTVGVDLDENGYGVTVSGPTPVSGGIAPNGSVTFSTLIPGDYEVALSGVATNCVVTGPHPRPVTVVGGAPTPLALDVTCSQARQLALVFEGDGNPEIYVVKENGFGLTRLTINAATDVDPAWSPDGSKIAFGSNRDGNWEIYVMNPDGSNPIRLTNTAANETNPTWSPDGSKIAFSRNLNGAVDLHVMDADGSNVVPLTTDGAAADENDPDWSATGIITFRIMSGGTSEIWVMDADGGNRRQLTTTGSNYEPSWSPDGSKITYRHDVGCGSYGCDYDLYIINADGSGNASVNNNVNAGSPDWSPDGQAIAFTLIYCSYYYYYPYCYNAGIGMMHPDGLGFVPILIAPSYGPAWRPGN